MFPEDKRQMLTSCQLKIQLLFIIDNFTTFHYQDSSQNPNDTVFVSGWFCFVNKHSMKGFYGDTFSLK